jgi:hypothetical protein
MKFGKDRILLYVACGDDDVIDVAMLKVTDHIPTGPSPEMFELSRDERALSAHETISCARRCCSAPLTPSSSALPCRNICMRPMCSTRSASMRWRRPVGSDTRHRRRNYSTNTVPYPAGWPRPSLKLSGRRRCSRLCEVVAPVVPSGLSAFLRLRCTRSRHPVSTSTSLLRSIHCANNPRSRGSSLPRTTWTVEQMVTVFISEGRRGPAPALVHSLFLRRCSGLIPHHASPGMTKGAITR